MKKPWSATRLLVDAFVIRARRSENNREAWAQCLSDGTVSHDGLMIGHAELVGLLSQSRNEILTLLSSEEAETALYEFDNWWDGLVKPDSKWEGIAGSVINAHSLNLLKSTANLLERVERPPTDAAIDEFRERLESLRAEAETLELPDDTKQRVIRDLEDLLAALDDPTVPGRSVVRRAEEKAGAYVVEALRDPERLSSFMFMAGLIVAGVAVLTGHAVDVGAALGGLHVYTKVMGSKVMPQLDRALGAQKAIESGPSGKPRELESREKDEDDEEADADE